MINRLFPKLLIHCVVSIAAAATCFAWPVPAAHFLAAPPAYAAGTGPFYVVTANLRGIAGRQDLIVTNPDFDNNLIGTSISVLLSNGDGTYQPGVPYSVGQAPISLAAGDFNKDGHPDVVVAVAGTNAVSLLLGNGDGTLQPATSIPVGVNPAGIYPVDLNKDGNLDLVVTNSSLFTGLPCSGSVSILLGNGNGTFTAQPTLSASACPVGIAVADFNGDGNLDLAVVNNPGMNSASPGTVSVYLGNGNGTFLPATNYGVNLQPFFVVAVDLNGDGKADLVVQNQGIIQSGPPSGDGISILLGNGDGTFQNAVNNNAVHRPGSLTSADVDGDGKADLVLASQNRGISILFGNGNGTFRPPVNYAVTPAGMAAAADLNGDGKLDIAVSNEATPGLVSVLLNNGSGAFPAPRHYGVGIAPQALAAGDLNNDNNLDLVTANGNYCGSTPCTGPNASVLLGNGDGSFQVAHGVVSGVQSSSVAIGDFNSDGKADLIVVNNLQSGNGSVKVMAGNGDGTFVTQVGFASLSNPFGVALGDFNADGKLDFAATNFHSGVAGVALNNGTPGGAISFAVPTGYGATTGFPISVAAADFNGDGKPDLAVAQNTQFCGGPGCTSDSVGIFLNNGSGAFPTQTSLTAGKFPASVVAADFNNDGKQDIAVVNVGDGVNPSTVSVFLNSGNATTPFASTPTANYNVGISPRTIAVGDFNGDGVPDLVVGNEGANGCGTCPPNTISVLLGNGSGGFLAATNYSVPGSPIAVLAADFNGDGAADIAVADEGDNLVTVLLNAGGTFIALGSTANPAGFDQSITFTATVANSLGGGTSPTGKVTFNDNGAPIGGPITLIAGQAVFTTSTLVIGSHPITASYSGDTNFNAHTSAVLTEVVNKAGTSLAVSSSVNPSNTGQPTTLTATVTSATSGSPTGTVQFLDGNTPLSTGTLASSGANSSQASIAPSFGTAGLHAITAVYGGDANYNGSNSAVLGQSVDGTGTTTTTTSITSIVPSKPTPGQAPGTVHVNQTVTITVTVATASGNPGGNVALTDNGVPLGTNVALPANASTQMVGFGPFQLSMGTHNIAATYFGDSTYQASSSATKMINHIPKPR